MAVREAGAEEGREEVEDREKELWCESAELYAQLSSSLIFCLCVKGRGGGWWEKNNTKYII